LKPPSSTAIAPKDLGRHRFNTRFWKTRERKPDTEVVEIAVPPIIYAAEFEAVQELLKTRSPALTAPRSESVTIEDQPQDDGLTEVIRKCHSADRRGPRKHPSPSVNADNQRRQNLKFLTLPAFEERENPVGF